MKVGQLGGVIAAASEGDRPRLQAEMLRTQARVKLSGMVALILLLLASTAMAIARYMG
jgi:hypothetical protein